MNIFEEFSVAREVELKEGKMTVDKQRTIFLPTNFMGMYSLNIKDNSKQPMELYESIKNGMINTSKVVGKEYMLSYKDFLDRWVKYCAFGGWGMVNYQLIEKEGIGLLNIKNLPMHMYLKNREIGEFPNVIFEGIIAGSLSGTFNLDIDVIEVKCICSGNDMCVYYWGPRKYLIEKFPEITSKRFGDSK